MHVQTAEYKSLHSEKSRTTLTKCISTGTVQAAHSQRGLITVNVQVEGIFETFARIESHTYLYHPSQK